MGGEEDAVFDVPPGVRYAFLSNGRGMTLQAVLYNPSLIFPTLGHKSN